MGEPNQALDFVRLDRPVVAAMYTDPGNSKWRITAVGEPQVIDELLESLDLRITLLPFDASEPAPLLPTEHTVEKEAEYKPLKLLHADADQPEPLPSPEQYPVEKEAVYQPPNGDDNPFALPGLELKLELVETSISGPRRVRFVLDPPIEAFGSRNYSFQLGPSDTTANVNFNSDVRLSVTLEGSGMRSRSSGPAGSVQAPAKGGDWWWIKVHNDTANAGTFNLSADFTLF